MRAFIFLILLSLFISNVSFGKRYPPFIQDADNRVMNKCLDSQVAPNLFKWTHPQNPKPQDLLNFADADQIKVEDVLPVDPKDPKIKITFIYNSQSFGGARPAPTFSIIRPLTLKYDLPDFINGYEGMTGAGPNINNMLGFVQKLREWRARGAPVKLGPADAVPAKDFLRYVVQYSYDKGASELAAKSFAVVDEKAKELPQSQSLSTKTLGKH
jgi:hypothetical protein